MGRYCCVPNCRSGYGPKKEKAIIFNAPADPERLAAWNRAVPQMKRELRSSDGICEKHFPSHMLSSRATHIEYKGRVLLHVPKRPRLSQDAVPCIFSGDPDNRMARKAKNTGKPPARRSHLSSSERQRHPKSDGPSTSALPQCSGDPTADAPNASALHNNMEPAPTTPSISAQCDDNTERPAAEVRAQSPTHDISQYTAARFAQESCFPEDEVQGNEETSQGACDPPLSFSELFEKPHLVGLPGKTWAVHTMDYAGVQPIDFSTICPKVDTSQPRIFERVLSISPEQGGGLTFNTFVWGKAVSTNLTIDGIKIASVHDLAHALKVLDRLVLCSGGPMHKDYPQVRPECAFVDLRDVWRHNRCTFVTSTDGQCPACRSLKNTLRIHAARLEKKKAAHSTKLRLVTFSPAKKAKVEQLKKARIACRRSRLRLFKSRQKLQEELTGCWQKLHDVQQDSLHELLAAANLSNAQLSVVEECIAAAKCKSKRQRRYDDNWLLLCLLLHIRTPTGYLFLRENDILPLPSVKTVRKYISMVGLKCGFDQDFFLSLKIKLQHKAESEKHGILIFDEIQWAHYEALFHQDQLVPGDLRVCPKLTVAHIHPSQTDKTMVKLATQVFSASMAGGLNYYQGQGIPELVDCEGTIHFTMRLNNLFDALNRRYPAEGL
ncbi:uncharacterized protein ISCGN_001849 [Ixodes scapularis]